MKILAISDQHGHLPEIPPCDLLIVAGDQCPDVLGGVPARSDHRRQMEWFERVWLPWRYRQPVGTCVVTWGNHDFCGLAMRDFTDQQGEKMTHIVCDNSVDVGGVAIYLTPWSNSFMRWAFMRDPAELAAVYAKIPTGLDVLVSHQPPLGYGSECKYLDPRDGEWKTEQVGSVELVNAISEKQPKVVICGHIHSGFGAYDCDGIPVYNVSVVDEGYSLVHAPTLIELPQADPCGRETDAHDISITARVSLFFSSVWSDDMTDQARAKDDDEPSVIGAGCGPSPMPSRVDAEAAWRRLYVERMVERGIDPDDAHACVESCQVDLSVNPCDAADDELQYWEADE